MGCHAPASLQRLKIGVENHEEGGAGRKCVLRGIWTSITEFFKIINHSIKPLPPSPVVSLVGLNQRSKTGPYSTSLRRRRDPGP